MTKVGLYAIGTSTTLESNKSPDGLLPPRPSDMLAVRIGQLTAWGLTPH